LAVSAGADYIGCGPAFATPIKAEKSAIGPGGIATVTAEVSVPVFAIGGIDETNIADLVGAGVDRVCVIRALACQDPQAAARRLRQALPA
jgi:thiamine-phosphate pyrophosphorylase